MADRSPLVGAIHQGVEGSAIDAALVTAFVEVVQGMRSATLFGFFQSPAVDRIEDGGNGTGLGFPSGSDTVPGSGADGPIGRTLQVKGFSEADLFAVDSALEATGKFGVEIAPALETSDGQTRNQLFFGETKE